MNQQFSIRTKPPFRFDTVGSFLRPQSVHNAKADFRAGNITAAELAAVEDEAIRNFVQKEKEAGLKCLGDGEFRRDFWHLDFIWGLNGISEIHDDEAQRAFASNGRVAAISGKVSFKGHPFLQDYAFLRETAGPDAICRINIPSPTQCLFELMRSENNGFEMYYGSDYSALTEDISNAYVAFVQAAYAQGCRSLQMDDCTWCCLASPQWLAKVYEKHGVDAAEIAGKMLELTNTVTQSCPKDMTVVEHICCGAYAREWGSLGGYTHIAPLVFPNLIVDGMHLKFDVGPLDPLAYVPDGVFVSFGIVDAKSPAEDDRARIVSMLKRAGRFHDLDQMGLNTQCGFSSAASRITMTEAQQWDKIALMRSIAEEIWE